MRSLPLPFRRFRKDSAPPCGRIHAEAADPGQLHHIAVGQNADDRVAVLRPRLQIWHDRRELALHEKHGADHDVGPCNVGAAASQAVVVAGELGCGMQYDRQSRHVAHQADTRAVRGAREMGVHRHDDHAHGGRATG